MFGQNLEVQLNSARTQDTTVVWRSFHDRSPSRRRGKGWAWVIGPVGDGPEAFQLSKANCLHGCGIFVEPATLSDP